MTELPDDMEAVVSERLAEIDRSDAGSPCRQAYFSPATIRALLLAYQERGRALRFYADEHEYPSDGPWGVNSDDFGTVARATLNQKGKSHDQ